MSDTQDVKWYEAKSHNLTQEQQDEYARLSEKFVQDCWRIGIKLKKLEVQFQQDGAGQLGFGIDTEIYLDGSE